MHAESLGPCQFDSRTQLRSTGHEKGAPRSLSAPFSIIPLSHIPIRLREAFVVRAHKRIDAVISAAVAPPQREAPTSSAAQDAPRVAPPREHGSPDGVKKPDAAGIAAIVIMGVARVAFGVLAQMRHLRLEPALPQHLGRAERGSRFSSTLRPAPTASWKLNCRLYHAPGPVPGCAYQHRHLRDIDSRSRFSGEVAALTRAAALPRVEDQPEAGHHHRLPSSRKAGRSSTT